ENGYDQVAWTSGEHQNTRWNLRKVVEKLAYSPEKKILQAWDKEGRQVFYESNMTPDRLPDYVGKELAQKLMKADQAAGGPAFRELSGQTIEVGGKGMLGFYGSQKTGELGMVGEFYRGYGKKWGSRVGSTEVPTRSPAGRPISERVHAVNVTPEMKSEILDAGQNIAKEYAPAKPLETGNYMMDPKGALHKLSADETHRQWIERNFSDPKAGVDQRRADFDRALEEGYVRVRNEKGGLLIEASKLNPTWVKDVNRIERLSPGDKPVYLDTFQKGSLKQHHFDDPQAFRDWLNVQREAGGPPRGLGVAEPRGFGRAAEGHPLAQFEGTQTPAVMENLAPFVEDKLNRLGNLQARLDDPDTGQQVVGLFKNERGENTLVLAGRGFEALNRVLKGALTDLNGASAKAEATESLVNFMERHPNQYIKDLAATLQPVKNQPLTFLMLTG
ncbi:MAG: hypothetical protein L0312_19590, partial [Acidobacteria bacterium]|nr:hypothetical protein [Acidobacteriota bacterium]